MKQHLTHKGHLHFAFLAADQFPPFRPDVTQLFGQELSGRGHRITWILTPKDQTPSVPSESWPYGPIVLGSRRAGRGLLTNLWNRWLDLRNDLRLATQLRTSTFDFVQLKDKFLSAIPVLLLSKWYGIPFIYWLSFPYPEEARQLADERHGLSRLLQQVRHRLFRTILYSAVLPHTTHIFVQSARMKETLVAESLDPDRITPVPMGVSLADVPDAPLNPRHEPLTRRPFRLAYLGTLSRLRNLGFLLRVLNLVRRIEPDTQLEFIGGGNSPEDERALAEEATALGLAPYITITGHLGRQDAWSHVRQADVCLSYIPRTPVLDVGSPTKLIEYLALNTVVIANDHPEQREVLAASGAGLCVASTEQAFADAIIHVFHHPEQARRMASKGRAYVREFRDYSILATQLEREYARIIRRTDRLAGTPTLRET